MAIPPLDFLDRTHGSTGATGATNGDLRHLRHLRQGVESNPPPDRPIDSDTADWLLTLSEAERRHWWRTVAKRYNRCHNWRQAEEEATEAMK